MNQGDDITTDFRARTGETLISHGERIARLETKYDDAFRLLYETRELQAKVNAEVHVALEEHIARSDEHRQHLLTTIRHEFLTAFAAHEKRESDKIAALLFKTVVAVFSALVSVGAAISWLVITKVFQ